MAQHVAEPSALFECNARALGDKNSQPLGELSCLDKRGIRIVDEVALCEPPESGQAGVEVLEMIEVAGSVHRHNTPEAPKPTTSASMLLHNLCAQQPVGYGIRLSAENSNELRHGFETALALVMPAV